jgi:hypothetical protein
VNTRHDSQGGAHGNLLRRHRKDERVKVRRAGPKRARAEMIDQTRDDRVRRVEMKIDASSSTRRISSDSVAEPEEAAPTLIAESRIAFNDRR